MKKVWNFRLPFNLPNDNCFYLQALVACLQESYQKKTLQEIFLNVTKTVHDQVQTFKKGNKEILHMQVPHMSTTLRLPLYLVDNPSIVDEQQVEEKDRELARYKAEAQQLRELKERQARELAELKAKKDRELAEFKAQKERQDRELAEFKAKAEAAAKKERENEELKAKLAQSEQQQAQQKEVHIK